MLYTIPASYLLVVLDKNISKKQAELNEIQYRSKVSWHSILDPCENWESSRELRLNSRLLHLDSRFSIPARLIKPERPLFTNDYKGFLFQVICALLSILSCHENLQSYLCSSFEQSSNFSHVKKISLLYKITTILNIWFLREIPELSKLDSSSLHLHSLAWLGWHFPSKS